MARKPKTKAPVIAVKVPQTRDEAATTLRKIGEETRRLARLEADMNDELAAVKERYTAEAAPIAATVKAETSALQVWCAANRDAICAKGTKTADLGTGKVNWRVKPASVSLKKVEDVIAALKSLGFVQFIRTKEEVNKEAMLADPEKARLVPGVTIGSEGEEFFVEPFEAELAQAVAA